MSGIVILAGALAACGGREEGRLDARALGVTRLAEADSFYVGQPGNFAVDDRGDYHIIDRLSRSVLVFSPEGTPKVAFGGPGQGPGEAPTPTLVLFPTDSTIVVTDFGEQRAGLLDRATKAFVRRVRTDGYVVSGEVKGGTIWLGLYSQVKRTGVGAWNLATDSIQNLVPLPDVYVPGSQIAASQVGVQVAVAGDSLLVGFTAVEPILVADGEGRVVDSLVIPAVRRRGYPPGWTEIRDFAESVSAKSTLRWLRRRTDGSFFAVHYDQVFERNALTGKIFVSVLSRDLAKACVDAPVPTSGEVRASVFSRGDTLFVLDQESGSGSRLRTFVTRYGLDTSRCTWITTRPWR
ncbi:MAG: hypothetical protein JNJ80_20100 [Gemmatimonadetes bacterium]|nr:hypothetical protein [Gemmatimonadota bacterium]